MSSEKDQCPYCKKWYRNINAHIKRLHPNEKPVECGEIKSSSTKELEKELAKKILSQQKPKEKELTVEEALKEEIKDKSPEEVEKEREKKKEKLKKQPRKVARKIVVDFWLTNLHDAEIGIYQKERFMAKNRMFSRSLELIGAVKEEGKPDGMFGYLSESWDNIPLKDIAKRRLVMKWFNSESVVWLGTIEEMVLYSIQNTYGSTVPVPAFKVMIPKSKYIIDLAEKKTKFPKLGEIYTFSLKDEKKDEWHVFTFDEDRLTIGSDWSILHGDDELIGKIDEKVVNIGGKFVIELYESAWLNMPGLVNVIVLFTMTLKFNKEIQKKIKKIIEYLELNKIKLNISASEEKFMMNPRVFRR